MTPGLRDDARRGEWSLLFLLSAAAHASGLVLLTWMPEVRMASPPRAIAVDLVAALPPGPAAPPRAAPPPPAAPAQVVLPKQPQREPSKPKVEPRPEPQPKPPPRVQPAPVPPPSRSRQVDYEDALADLRAAAGETLPERAPTAPDDAAAIASRSGSGRPVSPEVAAWMKQTEVHIRRSWVTPPEFTSQRIVAVVEVELDAGGRLVGAPRVLSRSGNPWYDEEVLRAVQRASPLPAPPQAARYQIAFDSQEEL